ncbi:MAG: glycosyltransferase 87 family protein [Actinomycetales bacterium]
MGRRSGLWAPVWLAATAAITWSVVRYELLIVAVLTASAVLLAVAVSRGVRFGLGGRWTMPLVLVGTAAIVELVPSFTYASRSEHRAAVHLAALTALVVAAAWVGPVRRLAPWLAGAGFLAVAVWVIRADPAPRIDVWVILQQASDGLAHGSNAYSSTWRGSPGETDAFTYLPMTLVLVAPGRWLAGDVRWALTFWTLAGAALLWAFARGAPARDSAPAWGAAALLLLVPGTTTQVEQSWTEPLLFALLGAWALLVSRERAWWAVVPLALALASKQHILLLLPLLALWQPFGWRRSAASAGLGGLLVLPWFLASPADLWHDTVTLLVHFHAIRFADTLYLAAVHELGWPPPFWLVGLVVLGVLAVAAVVIQRRQPPLDQLLLWCALVLFVANLVNKQAFYNQYWLVAALVLLAVAAGPGASLKGQRREVAQPVPGERGLGSAEDGRERLRRGHLG